MSLSAEDYQIWPIYAVWTTLQQMVHDRGYLVHPTHLDMPLEQWKEKFMKAGEEGNEIEFQRKDLTFLVEHEKDEANRLYVFFPDNPNVGMEDIKSYFEKMESGKVMRGIIAVQSKITPIAKQGMMEMAPKYILEQFLETELMVNITKHMYVPQHIVLSDDEKQTLLKQYRLSDEKMPRIQHTDPIAKYYGLVAGQVLKIVRRSKTAGRYVTYRIVFD
eukprot:m.35107 g.35107  ORF g.35107 m.35107 type:complete len:218 (-) comp17085_c2_seq1:1259-1912(-)